ncbi:MAG: VWA domain-containing protein [Gammaproteobacteria bacterium]|nr:MAG: VWA domain-containing protein [Gammaproteobacteria bacterium]
MSLPPFTAAEIEERLDDRLIELQEDVIAHIASLQDIQIQDALLTMIEKAATTSSGLAYQFGQRLPRAYELMEIETIDLWLDQAIDLFDSKGLYGAVSKLDELEDVAQHAVEKITGIAFDDVSGMLEHFVTGLNGRRLELDIAAEWHTDTETLFLPSMLNRFSNKQDNFSLYKCILVHLWAQTWFGTWRMDSLDVFQSFDNPEQALHWFHVLESIRLDACIQRELPGIHRETERLSLLAGKLPFSRTSLPYQQLLTEKYTAVDCTLDLLRDVYPLAVPQNLFFMGSLKPERVQQVRNIRLLKEKDIFRKAIAHLLEEKTGKKAADFSEQEKRAIDAERIVDPDMPQGFSFQLRLDGEPMPIPDDIQSLMDSIIQDIGLIPEDYLVAAGDGGYRYEKNDNKPDLSNLWEGTYHEEGATLVKEWDHRRQRYKKNWCAVRELDITAGKSPFVNETVKKYAGLVKSLRRTFEVLRGEDKILKKQAYGDDIDIDALVETWADVHGGLEMSDRIFTKMHKDERNIAVIFMVDMSGSTKGWINDAERESLVLLCEALETLGDRYAIYGFSSITRKRCEVFKIKTFDEDYNETVKGRIANILPQEYTRLGAFIRYFTEAFAEVEARTKLLITLSDGKPEDYDAYRGDYGIEDTRMALLEARREGIHPFCITIDREARDYLQHMYGPANYVLIDDVNKLPLKVADIYRHITS